MEPINQLTTTQVVTLALIAGGIATAIGAAWWAFTERFMPKTNDGRIQMLWLRIDALEKHAHAQDKEIDALREEKIADRAQISALKMEVDELYEGVKLLTGQIEAAGLTPVWRAHRRSPSARMAAHITLAGKIESQFNIEEMSGLAFDIGLDMEAVPGETRGERARQLADAARRMGKLTELERRIGELRPG